MRMVFIRHPLYKFIRTRKFTRTLTFLLTGILIAPAQIIENTSGKQHVILEYHGHLIAQSIQIIVSHIHTAYQNFSGGHIIKTRDQIDQTGFCATGSTEDTDRLPGMDIQVDIL